MLIILHFHNIHVTQDHPESDAEVHDTDDDDDIVVEDKVSDIN
jgi:hypothetical protein